MAERVIGDRVSSTWREIGGPPLSCAIWETTVARFAPALQPATTTMRGFRRATLVPRDPLQRGVGVFGCSRESCLGSEAVVARDDDAASTNAHIADSGSSVSLFPSTQPPPWKGRRPDADLACPAVQAIVQFAGRAGIRAVDDLANLRPGRASRGMMPLRTRAPRSATTTRSAGVRATPSSRGPSPCRA